MSEPSARERFAAAVAPERERIDVAEAALLIAAEEYPDLDVAHYLAELDELAREAAPALAGSDEERVACLNRFLFEERGFAGDEQDYDDPRNSFLNEVLERRRGIPITLAIVYVEVGRRLGLDAHGIGFPGHFLAKVVGEREIVVDPFFGRVLDPADVQARLEAAAGAGARLAPRVHLRAAAPREILVRMLTNLKVIGLRNGDLERALGCSERILLLAPDAPGELRDRALLYEEQGFLAPAISDWKRLLELAPDHPSGDAIRTRLAALGERAGRYH